MRSGLPRFGEGTTVSDAASTARGRLVASRYRLLELLGEGGMGAVWMAEQREPVKRLVAVKLVKPGMDSRDLLARFEAERQALALMDHENIARIFDGGLTDDGRPYFAMELVRGLPITEYCGAKRLPLRDRLKLFAQVGAERRVQGRIGQHVSRVQRLRQTEVDHLGKRDVVAFGSPIRTTAARSVGRRPSTPTTRSATSSR